MFLGEISKSEKASAACKLLLGPDIFVPGEQSQHLGPTQPSMGLRRRASAASGSSGFTLKPRGT